MKKLRQYFILYILFNLGVGCGFENLHEAVEVDPSSYKPGAFELFLGQRKPSRGFDVAATSDGNYSFNRILLCCLHQNVL